MKKEYNKLFKKVVPRMSDDELFVAVLNSQREDIMKNNEKQPKKRVTKAFLIPLAAAFAAAATAVGAVAVYNHNANEDYARVLQQDGFKLQEYKDKDGNDIDENLKAVNNGLYEGLNIELNKTFECDGFTLEFPGAVCDGEDMLIFYNATFTEGQEFHPNDNLGLEPKEHYFGSEKVTYDGRGIIGKFEKVDGNTVFSGVVSINNIDTVTEDVLSINFTNLEGSYEDPNYLRQSFDLDITLDIPLADDMDKYNKTVEVPSAPHIDIGNWGDWDVNEVNVTPLRLVFNMSADHDTPESRVIKNFAPAFPTVITFKDGSVLDLSKQIGGAGIDDENRTFVLHKRLDYPIDVENIETIQIASAVIDMNGGATTVDIPEVYERYAFADDDQK